MEMFQKYLRILSGKGFTLKFKDIQVCKKLIYGSETWPFKVKHEVKLDRNEMIMRTRRCICWFNLIKQKE